MELNNLTALVSKSLANPVPSDPTPANTSEEDIPYGFYSSVYEQFTVLSKNHCVTHRVPLVTLRHQDYSWCVICYREEQERILQESIKKHQALTAELARRGITYQEWVREREQKHRENIRANQNISTEEAEQRLEQLIGFSAYAFDETTYRPPPVEKSATVIRHLLSPEVHYFRKSLGLLFYGAPHTGKTLTALLIIRTWARLGKRVHYLTFSDLRNHLVSEGFKNRDACLNTCKHTEILVIDDIDYPRASILLATEVRNILHHRSLRLGITILITRADCSTLKASPPRELVNFDAAKLKQFKLVPFGDTPYPYLDPPDTDDYYPEE